VVVPRAKAARVDGALSSVSGPIRTWASVRVSDTSCTSRNTLLATSGSLYASCDFRHALMMRALFGQTTASARKSCKKRHDFLADGQNRWRISRGALFLSSRVCLSFVYRHAHWVGGVPIHILRTHVTNITCVSTILQNSLGSEPTPLGRGLSAASDYRHSSQRSRRAHVHYQGSKNVAWKNRPVRSGAR
jgi:hypothetical protein